MKRARSGKSAAPAFFGRGTPSALSTGRHPRSPSPTRDGVSGRRLYLPGDVLVERLPAELDRVGSGEAVRRDIARRQAEPRAVRVDPSPDVSLARRAGAARHAQHDECPGGRLAHRRGGTFLIGSAGASVAAPRRLLT